MLMIDNEPEKKSFGVISITRVTVRCMRGHAAQRSHASQPEPGVADPPVPTCANRAPGDMPAVLGRVQGRSEPVSAEA
jgi:hypothetical protein